MGSQSRSFGIRSRDSDQTEPTSPSFRELNDVLAWMLVELESNGLEVCKVPSRREDGNGRLVGGYVRVVVSVNCEWYRRFCASFARQRGRSPKMRTFIKRQDTIRTLKRMIAGPCKTAYAERLLVAAKEVWMSLCLPE